MSLETNTILSLIGVCRTLEYVLSFQDYQALGGGKTMHEYGVVLKSCKNAPFQSFKGRSTRSPVFNLGCVLPFVLGFIVLWSRQVLEAGRIVLQ
ncbi:MAG TPA: hypothetical protein VKM55_21030 [Candidatus Lokiarchaeia archaeon]|nr:hypothetical protein [Candidatus Lokiarchaeia archaeon]